MPERKGHGGSGCSRFDHMSTEELDEILRLDFRLPEGEGLDADTILYITEVIAGREASSSRTPCPDVEAAWRDLQEKYLPDGTNDLLGGGAESEPVLSPGQPSPAIRRHSRGIRWIIRIAGVAAILAVLFFATTITAYAFGYDVWGTIAKWSSETFSFAAEESGDNSGESGQSSTSPEFSSLQEALDYYGIETAIAPTWIPERFVLESVNISEATGFIDFLAFYTYEGDTLLVSAMFHKTDSQNYSQWQKDEGNPILYEKNGLIHYIMTNAGKWNAVWLNGTCECGIGGDISETELIAMIDSVYEERQ